MDYQSSKTPTMFVIDKLPVEKTLNGQIEGVVLSAMMTRMISVLYNRLVAHCIRNRESYRRARNAVC